MQQVVLCHVCHGSLLEVLGSCRRCLEADERRADNALEAADLQGLQALLRLVPFYLLMRSALPKPFPLSTARLSARHLAAYQFQSRS